MTTPGTGCRGCGGRIEWCAVCERADCGAAVCSRCLRLDLGLAHPHDHGG